MTRTYEVDYFVNLDLRNKSFGPPEADTPLAHVGVIEVEATSVGDALERAWEWLQRIDGGPENPGCAWLDERHAPSASVGDVLTITTADSNVTRTFAVGGIGFVELDALGTMTHLHRNEDVGKLIHEVVERLNRGEES